MSNSKRLSYAERVAQKRAKRLNPSPQAKAARTRAALRNHDAELIRMGQLSLLADSGDAVAVQLVSRG